MITTIASFIIFILYIVYILLKAKEIPISVSRTYYYLTWKPAFTLIIWLVGLLLLPEFMDAGHDTQKSYQAESEGCHISRRS